MKILHVIDRYGKEFGGSAEVCKKQVKALRKDGYEVDIYANELKPIPFDEYDLIHLHNYVTIHNLQAILKSHKTPIVWQPHGGLIFHKIRHMRSQPLKWFFKNHIAGLIAVSQQEIDQASKFLPYSKIHYVPNAIDLEDYQDLPERGLFRKKYDIPMDVCIYLYLGRNDWTKNLDEMYETYNSKKYFLVTVGVSDVFERNDNLINIPPLYGREKLEAYVDADLFILPSKYEIFGLTPLEAIACGTEVLVSDACGVKEIIDKYPDREELLSRYNWNVIIKDLEKVYESLRCNSTKVY